MQKSIEVQANGVVVLRQTISDGCERQASAHGLVDEEQVGLMVPRVVVYYHLISGEKSEWAQL